MRARHLGRQENVRLTPPLKACGLWQNITAGKKSTSLSVKKLGQKGVSLQEDMSREQPAMRCSWEHCPQPDVSCKFKRILETTRGGGRDWTSLAGQVLCNACFKRYKRCGSLEGGPVQRNRPLSADQRKCSYEMCLSPSESKQFLRIKKTTKAGGQDWSSLFGKVLCYTCYSSFSRYGSLDRSSAPSEQARRRSAASRGSTLGSLSRASNDHDAAEALLSLNATASAPSGKDQAAVGDAGRGRKERGTGGDEGSGASKRPASRHAESSSSSSSSSSSRRRSSSSSSRSAKRQKREGNGDDEDANKDEEEKKAWCGNGKEMQNRPVSNDEAVSQGKGEVKPESDMERRHEGQGDGASGSTLGEGEHSRGIDASPASGLGAHAQSSGKPWGRFIRVDDEADVHLLTKEVTTVGRGGQCDVIVDIADADVADKDEGCQEDVSRTHLRLTYDSGAGKCLAEHMSFKGTKMTTAGDGASIEYAQSHS
jgi:hypothetical protein